MRLRVGLLIQFFTVKQAHPKLFLGDIKVQIMYKMLMQVILQLQRHW